MAKKDDVLDRRTLDRYRKQISDDFDKEYREKMVKDLSEEVYNDVQKNFDVEYKNQLVENVTNDIYAEVKEKVNKEERKVSAHKSFKIFRLSVYILVLLACVAYVVFRLYKTDNFDIMKYDYTKPSTSQAGIPETTTEEKKEEIDYKALYGYLIDNIKVYDLNLYKGNHKDTDMSLENRLQIAYSTLTKDDIEVDGAIKTLRSSTLKSAYNKVFALDDFENASFKIYDLNYIYSPNKNEYISISEDIKDDVKYELTDASVDGDNIILKALTARVSEDKIYNVINNKEVGSKDDKLSDKKDKLSSITFIFNKDKKLIGLIGE